MSDLVTDAVAELATVGPALLAVGTAVIGLAAIALGIRWIKASFF